MTDTARLEAVVRGRVQGVGFRYFVLRRALRLGLTGWVANEPDGTVRCVAEGPTEAVDTLLSLLHSGPPGAHVEDVDTRRDKAAGTFASFTVKAAGHSGD